MENNEKVFRSEIVTSEHRYKNNLYDLLSIIPAKPLELKTEKKYTCDFVPKTDKIYVPKRRSKVKVKTVRDIRSLFESDTYVYLTSDLKSQQSYLLKKIRDGCSRNENTIKIAKKVLSANAPISRPAWQMLININPEDHPYPRQFVKWNGKLIQVNGSYGGSKKVISRYDLGDTKLSLKIIKKALKHNIPRKKKGLLQNSLAVKFKPGPLGRKKFLDDSHQKHHGDIELLDLPKVGLVIQPMYGTALDPTITQFLSDLRFEDGTISEKWAEFAVSVLGKSEKSNVTLLNTECMTFDLKYKCDQHRILMRKDLDNSCTAPTASNTCKTNENITSTQNVVVPEIKDMMNKILDAVEININQDKMFNIEEGVQQEVLKDSPTVETATVLRDKTRRKYCELGRLDVTVIQLPENCEKRSTQICGQPYCSLGCLCDSLNSNYKFRGHCGREECMFDCKCDFSKYTSLNSLGLAGTDLLPGIINIEDEINMRLAKEEQKFHQTVIVTSEKNILFKSAKRNWKSSKKYETFYKNMCLKNTDEKEKRKRELTISLLKLNCENIEPWCMVHNLYKCFCKGRFTESTTQHVHQNLTGDQIAEGTCADAECSLDKVTNINGPVKQSMRKRVKHDTNYLEKQVKFADKHVANPSTDSDYPDKRRKSRTVVDSLNSEDGNINPISEHSDLYTSNTSVISVSESSDSMDCYYTEYNGKCSRVNAYEGRKYSDGHYKNTNNKIKEMEKNDKTLHLRMMNILNLNLEKEKKDNVTKNQIEEIENNDKALQLRTMNILCINSEKEKEDNVTKNKEETPGKGSQVESTDVADRKLVNFLTGRDDMVMTSSEYFICGDKSTILVPSKRNLSCDSKLVDWLETNYKQYKKRIDQGTVKTSLDPPKIGKVSMYSWDFILSRYRDRKNLFLISKQPPYRIFMGVHTKSPFFASCININEIRFADLHKYPQTVKNLLTNATELKDNFCILRGLAHCWELVGSVTKVNKGDETTEEINDDIVSIPQSNFSEIQAPSDEQLPLACIENVDNQPIYLKECQSITEHVDETDSSKWFVMTVENDFTEIRFYKKGFFVKYESIVKAINVARISGKTVRLSSQKCVDKNNLPQFGVYAIPNTSEYCVFIGPYEMHDSLGIETIKSILDVRKSKRTRGFWLNTNKIDNLKVIDNPLSFMPLNGSKNSEAVTLDNNFCEDNKFNHQDSAGDLHEREPNAVLQKPSPTPEKKIVKPIKIRKTNGFYHLATDGMLKKISLKSPPKVLSIGTPTIKTKLAIAPNLTTKTCLLETGNKTHDINSSKKANTDKGLQIKISAIYSQKEDLSMQPKENNKKTEGGMLILKPEEINRKLFQGQLKPDVISPSRNEEDDDGGIDNFAVMEYPLFRDELENSATLIPCTTNADVLVISDDEEDAVNDFATNDDRWKDVLILCTNVTDLGWVWGRQNCNSRFLSFKVPGGQYSDFYPEEEAFKKLNEALSTIVGPARPFDLNWKVVNSTDDIQGEVSVIDCEILYRIGRARSVPLALKTKGDKHSNSVPSNDPETLKEKMDKDTAESNDSAVLTSTHVKTYSKKSTVPTASASPVIETKEKNNIPETAAEEKQA